jgi:hypothetical protein
MFQLQTGLDKRLFEQQQQVTAAAAAAAGDSRCTEAIDAP